MTWSKMKIKTCDDGIVEPAQHPAGKIGEDKQTRTLTPAAIMACTEVKAVVPKVPSRQPSFKVVVKVTVSNLVEGERLTTNQRKQDTRHTK